MPRYLSLALLLLAACASPLAEGEAQFKKGRYPEAKRTFVAVEAESRGWTDERHARYALYRGMTHGALGDLPAAALWLSEAKATEDAHPGSLSHEDFARLKLALEQLDVPAPESSSQMPRGTVP